MSVLEAFLPTLHAGQPVLNMSMTNMAQMCIVWLEPLDMPQRQYRMAVVQEG